MGDTVASQLVCDEFPGLTTMVPVGATCRDIIMSGEDLEGLSKETQGSNV